MPETFSPVTHVLWSMPGSLTSSFLLSQWQAKCSRHSRRMRHPRFCVYGKRPITSVWVWTFQFPQKGKGWQEASTRHGGVSDKRFMSMVSRSIFDHSFFMDWTASGAPRYQPSIAHHAFLCNSNCVNTEWWYGAKYWFSMFSRYCLEWSFK